MNDCVAREFIKKIDAVTSVWSDNDGDSIEEREEIMNRFRQSLEEEYETDEWDEYQRNLLWNKSCEGVGLNCENLQRHPTRLNTVERAYYGLVNFAVAFMN